MDTNKTKERCRKRPFVGHTTAIKAADLLRLISKKITGLPRVEKQGAGYFFVFWIITIINPINVTMNKPKVSIIIIES